MKGRFTLNSILFFSCFLWPSIVFPQISNVNCAQLMVQAEVQGSCSERSTGAVALRVSGGKAPYSFAWDNGSQGEQADYLAPGTYMVTIRDAAGCSTSKQYRVDELKPLQASVNLVHNKNPKKSKGAISVQVSGGSEPYYYSWESEKGVVRSGVYEDQNYQQNLPSGWYRIRVFDASRCSVVIETAIK